MNPADKEIVQLPIRVEKWLKNRLQELADKDDRSLNIYCVKVLESHIKEKENNGTGSSDG